MCPPLARIAARLSSIPAAAIGIPNRCRFANATTTRQPYEAIDSAVATWVPACHGTNSDGNAAICNASAR